MYVFYDEDEYETIITSRPCTACGGDSRKCNGACNGSFGLGHRRRDSSEVKKIKADRERKREDAVLVEAEIIRRRRESAGASLDEIGKRYGFTA